MLGFPGGKVVKNPPANAGDAGDTGSIPGSGRSPGDENGNPLQYSCQGNPKNRGTWQSMGSPGSWGRKRVGYNVVTEQQFYSYYASLSGSPSFSWL